MKKKIKVGKEKRYEGKWKRVNVKLRMEGMRNATG